MDDRANLFLYELYKRMPIDKKHPYFNLTAEEFYRKYRSLFEFYEDNYSGLLPMDKNIKILDVGFGYGLFMIYMKINGFKNICGVEYNKEQADNAKKMGFNAMFISDLAGYLKDNRSEFDLIHASNVVEHLPKHSLIEVFDLLYGSLKDRGRLMAVVPNIAGWRGSYNRYFVLGHETGFSETALKQLFWVTHFEDIKILGSCIKFRLRIKHIIMKIMQKILDIVIGMIDFIYLGADRPKYINAYLFGVGVKKIYNEQL